jgi:hypothetical protein
MEMLGEGCEWESRVVLGRGWRHVGFFLFCFVLFFFVKREQNADVGCGCGLVVGFADVVSGAAVYKLGWWWWWRSLHAFKPSSLQAFKPSSLQDFETLRL